MAPRSITCIASQVEAAQLCTQPHAGLLAIGTNMHARMLRLIESMYVISMDARSID
jgi:hypothetical protein